MLGRILNLKVKRKNIHEVYAGANQPQETQVKNRRNCQRSKNRRENKLESRKEQTDKKINRKERKTYTTET